MASTVTFDPSKAIFFQIYCDVMDPGRSLAPQIMAICPDEGVIRFISQRAIVKQIAFGDISCFENPKSPRAFVLLELEDTVRKTIINNVVATNKDRDALCRYIQAVTAGFLDTANYEFGYPKCPNVLIDPQPCKQLDINGNLIGDCIVSLKKHLVLVHEKNNGRLQLIPSVVLFATSLDFSPYDDPKTSIVQLIIDNPQNPRQKLFYIFDFDKVPFAVNWRNQVAALMGNAKIRAVSQVKENIPAAAAPGLAPNTSSSTSANAANPAAGAQASGQSRLGAPSGNSRLGAPGAGQGQYDGPMSRIGAPVPTPSRLGAPSTTTRQSLIAPGALAASGNSRLGAPAAASLSAAGDSALASPPPLMRRDSLRTSFVQQPASIALHINSDRTAPAGSAAAVAAAAIPVAHTTPLGRRASLSAAAAPQLQQQGQPQTPLASRRGPQLQLSSSGSGNNLAGSSAMRGSTMSSSPSRPSMTAAASSGGLNRNLSSVPVTALPASVTSLPPGVPSTPRFSAINGGGGGGALSLNTPSGAAARQSFAFTPLNRTGSPGLGPGAGALASGRNSPAPSAHAHSHGDASCMHCGNHPSMDDAALTAAAAAAASGLPRNAAERQEILEAEAAFFTVIPPPERVPYELPEDIITPAGSFVDQALNVYSDSGQWMGRLLLDEQLPFPDLAGRVLHRIVMPLVVRERLPCPGAILASNGRLYDAETFEKIGLLRIGALYQEETVDIPEAPGGNKGRSRLVKGISEARKALEEEALRRTMEEKERRAVLAKKRKAERVKAVGDRMNKTEWGGRIGQRGDYDGYGDGGAAGDLAAILPSKLPVWAEGVTGLPLAPEPPRRKRVVSVVKTVSVPKRRIKVGVLKTGFDLDEAAEKKEKREGYPEKFHEDDDHDDVSSANEHDVGHDEDRSHSLHHSDDDEHGDHDGHDSDAQAHAGDKSTEVSVVSASSSLASAAAHSVTGVAHVTLSNSNSNSDRDDDEEQNKSNDKPVSAVTSPKSVPAADAPAAAVAAKTETKPKAAAAAEPAPEVELELGDDDVAHRNPATAFFSLFGGGGKDSNKGKSADDDDANEGGELDSSEPEASEDAKKKADSESDSEDDDKKKEKDSIVPNVGALFSMFKSKPKTEAEKEKERLEEEAKAKAKAEARAKEEAEARAKAEAKAKAKAEAEANGESDSPADAIFSFFKPKPSHSPKYADKKDEKTSGDEDKDVASVAVEGDASETEDEGTATKFFSLFGGSGKKEKKEKKEDGTKV